MDQGGSTGLWEEFSFPSLKLRAEFIHQIMKVSNFLTLNLKFNPKYLLGLDTRLTFRAEARCCCSTLGIFEEQNKSELATLRVRLVYVFKNWKMLFENIYENTCGWKSALKCVKCCLKTENGCLKSQTKHPLILWPEIKQYHCKTHWILSIDLSSLLKNKRELSANNKWVKVQPFPPILIPWILFCCSAWIRARERKFAHKRKR